jgi:hypothetical protein
MRLVHHAHRMTWQVCTGTLNTRGYGTVTLPSTGDSPPACPKMSPTAAVIGFTSNDAGGGGDGDGSTAGEGGATTAGTATGMPAATFAAALTAVPLPGDTVVVFS